MFLHQGLFLAVVIPLASIALADVFVQQLPSQEWTRYLLGVQMEYPYEPYEPYQANARDAHVVTDPPCPCSQSYENPLYSSDPTQREQYVLKILEKNRARKEQRRKALEEQRAHERSIMLMGLG